MTYDPQIDLLAGIRRCWPAKWYPGDEYFFDMANVDLLSGRTDVMAVKSFFVREAPFGGSYCNLGGITQALRDIMDIPFRDPEYQRGLLDMGFGQELIDYYAAHARLQLQVWAPYEGSVFFPREPVVSIVGPLPDVRMAEGILIQALNFPSLNITDWHRAVRAAAPGTLSDQSYRRSQDSLRASLYGLLAGCTGSSNVELRRSFQFPLMGTMGHEWMMSYGSVSQAFDEWLSSRPHKPILLVDTCNTTRVDFPAALDAIWNHREAIVQADAPAWGFRNDSGDLAYLVVQQYADFLAHPLSELPWFSERLRFPVANDLDEFLILSLKQQIRRYAAAESLNGDHIAGLVLWGIGTKKGSSTAQPSLGGVVKLMQVEDMACVKLALTADGRPDLKTSIPGFDFSCFVRDGTGGIKGVLIFRKGEHEVRDGKLYNVSTGQLLHELPVVHPDFATSHKTYGKDYTLEQRQKLLYDTLTGDGLTADWNYPAISTVQDHIRREVNALPEWITDLLSPAPMKVSLTPELFHLRQRMIGEEVIREDQLSNFQV